MENRPQSELSFADVFDAVRGMKWPIILGTAFCVILATVVVFLLPEVHQTSMVFEPGIIGVDPNGKLIYIDTAQNIAEKIRSDAYNQRITQMLDLRAENETVKFVASQKSGAALIQVVSECESNGKETGINILKHLFLLVSKDYEEIVGQKRKDYEKQISVNNTKIAEIEAERKDIDQLVVKEKAKIAEIEAERKDIVKQISLRLNDYAERKTQIKHLEEIRKIIVQREQELSKELRRVRENAKVLEDQRNEVLKGKGEGDGLSLLLYGTTIQQSIAYFNRLGNQINDSMKKSEETSSKIAKLSKEVKDIQTEIGRLELKKKEGLQARIDDIEAEIGRLELKKKEGLQARIDNIRFESDRLRLLKDLTQNMRVIQPPEVSVEPVKPRKMLVVTAAGAVGFIVMIFIAVIRRYNKGGSRPIARD